MRLIKLFGLAALAAVAAMAFVGATSASATTTQLCKVHTGLTCGAGNGAGSGHLVLAGGTVAEIYIDGITILCLSVLFEANSLGLASTQSVHITSISFSGCGTGSTHNNCTVTLQELPLSGLLKTGLNEGILRYLSGRIRYACSNLGIDCVYDLEGAEFSAGANHFTAEETPTTELGGKFFCSDEGFFSGLLESLTDVYILA